MRDGWPSSPSGNPGKSTPCTHARRARAPTQTSAGSPCVAPTRFRSTAARARWPSRRIAIFRYASREQWFATDNRCPHRGSEVLAQGRLADVSGEPSVVCPMHQSAFALTDGSSA
ncbi:MAG: nitrite reductase (NAD(P)H) small subunit [Deltaproteobacteria bacterium]|nr:nitrite reductase (NAD(P)H) small subunit [Deltaproteobacteria bacterium]